MGMVRGRRGVVMRGRGMAMCVDCGEERGVGRNSAGM